jgi:outer membrane protein assembly factor BamD
MFFGKITVQRLFIVLLLSCTCLAGFSQEPLPREEDIDKMDEGPERPSTRKIFRGGFQGLAPEEAMDAQRLLEEGVTYQEAGSYKKALGRFKKVYKKYPRSSAAPEAYFRTGEIQVIRGYPQKAFEAFDAILRAYPNYGRFNDLVRKQYEIATAMTEGQRTKIFGMKAFPNKDKGLTYYQRMVFNAPHSDYAPLAFMNMADLMIRRRHYTEATLVLDKLITAYPNSIVTSDAYLRMGQTLEKTVIGPHYDQHATKESINHYEDFLILYPRDPNVGQAEDGLARMQEMEARSRIVMADFYYDKRKRYQAARVFYNEAITLAPTSQIAETARERLAQLELDEAKDEVRIAREMAKGQTPGFLGVFRRTPPQQQKAPTGEIEAQIGN